jgi:hypothetical protein
MGRLFPEVGRIALPETSNGRIRRHLRAITPAVSSVSQPIFMPERLSVPKLGL